MSVNGRPCKRWKHVEVVAQLRGVGEEGVSLQVVSMLPSPEPRSTVNPWPGRRSPNPQPHPALVFLLGVQEASERRWAGGCQWRWLPGQCPPVMVPP